MQILVVVIPAPVHVASYVIPVILGETLLSDVMPITEEAQPPFPQLGHFPHRRHPLELAAYLQAMIS